MISKLSWGQNGFGNGKMITGFAESAIFDIFLDMYYNRERFSAHYFFGGSKMNWKMIGLLSGGVLGGGGGLPPPGWGPAPPRGGGRGEKNVPSQRADAGGLGGCQ